MRRGSPTLPAVLLVLGATLAGCSSDPKLRQPAKLVDIPKATQVPDAKTLWSARLGDGTDGMTASIRLAERDGTLFTADAEGKVAAYEARTGKRLWRTDTKTRVIGGPGTGPGLVLALNASTGAVIWKTVVTSEVAAAPVADADTVVARSIDGFVFGLRASTGERLWSFDRTVPSLTLRGLSDPLLLSNGRVVVGLDNGRVVALELADGQPTWEQVISQPSGRSELDRLTDIDAKLVLDPRTGYVMAASYGGEVAALEPTTGEARWRREIKSESGVALAGNRLAVSGDDGTIWLLDTDTGALIWKQEALKYRQPSPPVIYRNRVGVGDFEGYLHWLDIRTGDIVGRERPHKDPIRAPFVVDDGVLYGMDVEGRIFALSLPATPDDPAGAAPAASTPSPSRSFGLFGGGANLPTAPLPGSEPARVVPAADPVINPRLPERPTLPQPVLSPSRAVPAPGDGDASTGGLSSPTTRP